MSLPSLRQVIGALIVIFIIYAVLSDPAGSADVTGNAWGQVKDGFGAVSTFFTTLIAS
jgi:hypothetical protein